MTTKWFTPAELAKHWQVSQSQIYALVRQRLLKAAKIGRLVRISAEDADAYMREASS